MKSTLTPYRIDVFGTSEIEIKKGKRARKERRGWAIQAWNPVNHFEPGRLPGAGSFLFPGLHAARSTALLYFQQPEIEQVSIRTNQDKEVFRFWRPAAALQMKLFSV